MTEEKKTKKQKVEKKKEKIAATAIKLRGRTFKGIVVKKFPGRISIEFERTVYINKYERYSKKKTKLHAKLPKELEAKINVGDYVEIRECRPISKIINFIVVGKVKGGKNS